MPYAHEPVIVYAGRTWSGGVKQFKDCEMIVLRLHNDPDDKYRMDADDVADCRRQISVEAVTHWMPLPPPPNAGGVGVSLEARDAVIAAADEAANKVLDFASAVTNALDDLKDALASVA